MTTLNHELMFHFECKTNWKFLFVFDWMNGLKYQISAPYVANAGSFKPIISPNNRNITQIIKNDWLKPIVTQQNTKNTLVIINAFRLPTASLSAPPNKQPIGLTIFVMAATKSYIETLVFSILPNPSQISLTQPRSLISCNFECFIWIQLFVQSSQCWN